MPITLPVFFFIDLWEKSIGSEETHIYECCESNATADIQTQNSELTELEIDGRIAKNKLFTVTK